MVYIAIGNDMDLQIQRLIHLKKQGFEPKFILDVGACVGDWTTMVKSIYPQSEILMFEPNEDNEAKLWATNCPYKLVLLGNEFKKVDYFAIKKTASQYNTGNSIFIENTKHYTDEKYEIRKINMTTLDYELKNFHLKNPEFMKIDVQGAELLVLEGAIKTIESLEFILLEVQLLEFNKAAPMFAEVNAKMDAYHYQVYDVYGLHYLPDQTLFQLDILYCKKDSRFIKKGQLV
jgi:FkbM family methyltransferase